MDFMPRSLLPRRFDRSIDRILPGLNPLRVVLLDNARTISQNRRDLGNRHPLREQLRRERVAPPVRVDMNAGERPQVPECPLPVAHATLRIAGARPERISPRSSSS